MSEASLSSYVMKGMKVHWDHANRHEDSVSVGVADISYYLNGNSWIELKNINKIPVRDETPVRMAHFTEVQHHFLTKRHGWLLIRFLRPKRCYLLFSHHNLPPWQRAEEWSFLDMEYHATKTWYGRIQWHELAALLRVTK